MSSQLIKLGFFFFIIFSWGDFYSQTPREFYDSALLEKTALANEIDSIDKRFSSYKDTLELIDKEIQLKNKNYREALEEIEAYTNNLIEIENLKGKLRLINNLQDSTNVLSSRRDVITLLSDSLNGLQVRRKTLEQERLNNLRVRNQALKESLNESQKLLKELEKNKAILLHKPGELFPGDKENIIEYLSNEPFNESRSKALIRVCDGVNDELCIQLNGYCKKQDFAHRLMQYLIELRYSDIALGSYRKTYKEEILSFQNTYPWLYQQFVQKEKELEAGVNKAENPIPKPQCD